jgi:hypothetical protein
MTETCPRCTLQAFRFIDHLGIGCCRRMYLGDCPALRWNPDTKREELLPAYDIEKMPAIRYTTPRFPTPYSHAH